MNPNARSFAFNPNAGGFVPPQLAQYQQQQQQEAQPGQPVQPGQQAQQYYQHQQQPGFPPQAQQGLAGAGGAYAQYQQAGQGFINPQAAQYGAAAYPNNQYQYGQYSGLNNNNRGGSNAANRGGARAGAAGGGQQSSNLPRSSGLPPPPIPRAPLPNNPSLNSADSNSDAPPRKPVSLSIGGGAANANANANAAAASSSDLPRKPVSISIGGAGSTSSTNDSAPRKPVSLSIGGGAAKKAESEPSAAAPAPSATPAAAESEESSTTDSKAADEAEEGSSAPVPAPAPAPAGAVSALKSEEAPSSSPQAQPTSSSSPSTPGSSSPRSQSPTPAASAKKSSASAATKGGEKSNTNAEKVLEEVKQVTDEETMKDLFGDNAADLKSHLNVVFIGHVDAGKSTMGGNLLYLTGMVDKRTLEKYERDAKEAGRESWYLSWALDSTQQEREKGKTVEVGRAYFETGKRRYTILDAPGHKSYVPHMISGAAQADVAILVISARRGEFETGFEKGGQTREHAMLVKTAGVQKLIVVINKMDESTVGWAQERYDEITGKLTPFLRSAGFNPKTDITYVPVSAFSGHNLKDPVPKEVCSWYDGPPLLSFLDDLTLGDRKIQDPLKMPISEKYNDMGTVVVGKLEAGKVRKGDSLLVMPNKTQVEVLSIFNEQEEEVPAAISGDNIRIKLKGIDHEDVSVGFILSDAKKPVHVVTQFEAQLAILDTRNIICAGYSAVMHIHTLAEEVQLKALLHYYDKKTGKKSRKPPQFAKKGMKIVALIETTAPVCVEKFSEHPQLGRFTLRDEGKTIGIGRVQKLIQSESDLPDLSKLSVEAVASHN